MPNFGGGSKCPQCEKTVYMAEEIIRNSYSYHKQCFKCSLCDKSLDTSTVSSREDKLYCMACYQRSLGVGLRPHPSDMSGPTGVSGGSRGCPRCDKTVYSAEEITGAGRFWHKRCFYCKTCNKRLDSVTVSDHEGEIYCKACYGRSFGPKGYGYGSGAGALTNTGHL